MVCSSYQALQDYILWMTDCGLIVVGMYRTVAKYVDDRCFDGDVFRDDCFAGIGRRKFSTPH